MDLTDRDTAILAFVAEHYAATAEQVRATVSPANADTAVIRRRLRRLHAAGLVHVSQSETISPTNGVPCRVYSPAPRGVLELARRTGAMRWTLTPTRPPYVLHLAHFVALTDVRVLVKAVVAADPDCTLGAYYNQFDTTNPDATDPARRYTLYTEVQREPRKIACVPDAAFMLRLGAFCKAFYLELERGTTAPAKAAAKKSPGYAGLAAGRLHRGHFPDAADEFSVLVLAPHAGWRDSLRREFAGRPRPDLYKFAAMTEVTAETLLHGPIWHPCVGEAHPLLKSRPAPVPGGVSPGMPAGGPAGVRPVTPAGTEAS